MRSSLILIFWIAFTCVTNAQTNKVFLDNTEQLFIPSKFVQGENYSIHVSLPLNYGKTTKQYPVLYVLDGDKSFGMTKGIADWLMWSQEIADIIVVGISYGQGTDAWWIKRARDYSHCEDTILTSNMKWLKETGGAESYIQFIQSELFPLINKTYRTNPDQNAIIGISLAGMLSSYLIFNHTEMFSGFIVIAPSLIWKNKSILKMEEEYFKTHKELNKSVFMCYGSLDNKEWINEPTDEMIQNIKSHNYEGLRFEPRIFENETHISVYSTAITNGLKFVFKRE